MNPATARTSETPAELTATVSSFHLSRADLERIRRGGWMLPHDVSPDRISLYLALPQDITLEMFCDQLLECGYNPALADLVRQALGSGRCWLVVDEQAEPDDKLPIFVG